MFNHKAVWRVHQSLLWAMLGCVLFALAGCSDAAPTPTAAPLVPQSPIQQPLTPQSFVVQPFTPLDQLTKAGGTSADSSITSAGYLYADAGGLRLLDDLGLSTGATPQPLTPTSQQLWISDTPSAQIEQVLHAAGTARIAPVIISGTLEGPGHFGPQGNYMYQLHDPRVDVLVPQDTTLKLLFANATNFQYRLVRVFGTLFAQGTSGLLVEQADANGMPAPGALQTKLAHPIRDQALLARLRPARDAQVRFGQVQVEGFWINGTLQPLSIVPAT